MSVLLESLDPKRLGVAVQSLERMREMYPSYPDHELLLYCLAQALTNVKDRRPLP